MTKKRYRELLALLRMANKNQTGLRATLLCMAISHARGLLHCRTYALYNGGWAASWRTALNTSNMDVPARPKPPEGWTDTDHAQAYLTRFGDDLRLAEQRNYRNAAIFSLADQAVFLARHIANDEERERRLPEYRKAGRTIYSWMEPVLESSLRLAIKEILSMKAPQAREVKVEVQDATC